MIGFAKRNLLVFFKDRTAVFFSLLSVFIIIGLYALFLGDVWVDNFQGMSGVRYLMDSWIMAGLLAVTSITTTMGAFGIMVDDKVRKIDKDIASSPLKRSSIAGGYVFSSFIIGVIMSFITLVLAEFYVLLNGGELMTFSTLCKVAALVLLSTFTNTSIVYFLVSFFSSPNAFATASTIIGTLIGFLTGIYLPIGELPAAVQWVMKLFPFSHSAALFRQVMMADPIAKAFAGAPAEELQSFKEFMGGRLQIWGHGSNAHAEHRLFDPHECFILWPVGFKAFKEAQPLSMSGRLHYKRQDQLGSCLSLFFPANQQIL